jgi:hypothetical protein
VADPAFEVGICHAFPIYPWTVSAYKEKEIILRKRKTCMPPIAYMN